jgi:hypothetical protein
LPPEWDGLQHYEITVVADETGTKAAAITWTKTPVTGSMLTDPGRGVLSAQQ